ncbi:chromosome transmission fidelity protein 8 [Capronia epimyces CBS 606.96]|uniref:Chromosome transmission fidelity protein 8 n=1 Tax=Capronia epimyces CBS 606.96 TaxID=1182542 RepID=W9X954_9EURO|nr:chromosome transmission fidelity protein 8 [Capronia epimyces CBS 606.96]EXJ76997.1 chromosome transmission fidelity protein 8 [Capronia epimyces CBS 606.96]
MPAVQLSISPPVKDSKDSLPSPLPSLLQTPSGLAIVEIQGTIHGPFQHAVEDPNPVETTPIGRLEFPLYNPQDHGEGKWMKKVYLYVGKHQRLTGEIKKLAKPLAVVQKKNDHDGMRPDSTESQPNDDLEIVDIVKFKLLFSGRPEPVSE